MLSSIGQDVKLISWLRYTAWIPLYPLGILFEGMDFGTDTVCLGIVLAKVGIAYSLHGESCTSGNNVLRVSPLGRVDGISVVLLRGEIRALKENSLLLTDDHKPSPFAMHGILPNRLPNVFSYKV